MNTPAKQAYMRQWRTENRVRCREYNVRAYHKDVAKGTRRIRDRKTRLRINYNLTIEQDGAMLEKQSGVCAICSKPETKTVNGNIVPLAVDHDHNTGVVRGLLCDSCNVGLGRFKDDPALLKAAIAYLQLGSALHDQYAN